MILSSGSEENLGSGPKRLAPASLRPKNGYIPMTIDESWYQKPEGVDTRTAAGGVVARVDAGRILLAFAVEQEFDGYVLPKGHVDPGESVEEAARREIAEEVGVTDLRLIGPLGALDRLSYDKAEWKRTHYFLFATRQVQATPTDTQAHQEMAWFPLDELPPIFWPEQRALIEENRESIERLVAGQAAK